MLSCWAESLFIAFLTWRHDKASWSWYKHMQASMYGTMLGNISEVNGPCVVHHNEAVLPVFVELLLQRNLCIDSDTSKSRLLSLRNRWVISSFIVDKIKICTSIYAHTQSLYTGDWVALDLAEYTSYSICNGNTQSAHSWTNNIQHHLKPSLNVFAKRFWATNPNTIHRNAERTGCW